MTISVSNNTPRVSYTVSEGATQTSFTVNFEFFADADLRVFVDNTLKTITTHYTVSGGNGSTGTVTMSVTGGSGGSIVVITRDIALERTTDFPTQGAFNISSLNTELDKLVAIDADVDDTINRSVRLQDSDSAVSMELPLLASRKGTVLGFNASTGAAEAGPTIANVNSLSAITANINTVAGIQANVTTVAGISSNVTSVANNASNINSAVSNASNINSAVSNASNINTVAGISSNVTTVAGISSDVTSVAGIASNVTTVAGKASLITSAFASGMSLVTADFVSDVNTLAVTDVINDINLLATSDIVSDINQLATSDIISDLNTLATSDIVSDLNALAVSDVISDINTLATSDIVTDLNLLATSDFVSDLNTMATTTNVNNLSTVAGANSNIATVASNIGNINTAAAANTNVNTVAGAIANVNTVATNVASVNNFAERYRVGSSEPTSSLDAGDLFFNTSTNELRAYNGSSFQATSPSSSDQTNINIVAGEITAQEDLGSITESVATSSGNNINTVGSAIANVNTVAGISANVSTVAGISSNVTTVAGIASNVTSVAGNSSNINSAVSNASNINAAVSNATNINTVAGIASDVTAVANNSSNINSAVSNASNINAAVSNATNINSVVSNATNINTVASNITGVNSFAERYRVASSAPTSSLDAGDLYFDTTANTLNYYTGSSFQAVVAGAMTSLVVDTSPQLGGALDVNGNAIVSASNGNIAITPNGSGKVILDGLSHPTSDGSAGQFLKTDGGGNLSFATVNTDLSNDSSPQLGGNLDVNGNSIVSASNGDITIAPNGSGEINLNGTVNTDNLTIDFGSIA